MYFISKYCWEGSLYETFQEFQFPSPLSVKEKCPKRRIIGSLRESGDCNNKCVVRPQLSSTDRKWSLNVEKFLLWQSCSGNTRGNCSPLCFSVLTSHCFPEDELRRWGRSRPGPGGAGPHHGDQRQHLHRVGRGCPGAARHSLPQTGHASTTTTGTRYYVRVVHATPTSISSI